MKLVLIITMAVVVLGISVSFISVQGQQDYDIPQWVKNIAGYWTKGMITDDNFISSIQYLVNNQIINP